MHGQSNGWTVESAGTWTQPNSPAVPQAKREILKSGLSLEGHFSRQVTFDLLQRFDLILAMEAGQVEAMQTEFSSAAYKIHLLTEIVSGISYNIPDPFVSDVVSSEISNEIYDLIKGGFDRIVLTANELCINPPKD